MAAHPKTRVWLLWRDQCLVAGDPPVPLLPSTSALHDVDLAGLVILGADDGTPYFAFDLSDLRLEDALASVGADAAVDTRSLFAGLTAAQAGILAYARGVLYWNRRQHYCGCCGSAAQPRNGGHLRVCENPECATLLFPRIEPAVITLIETLVQPRRCLLARHRASTTGRFSLLAGFVEIGESLEDAVRREVFEEAGVVLSDVSYLGSQPWPFPAGLMVAFRASSPAETLSVDGNEILEARWFTYEELRVYDDITGPLGRADSIDRPVLTAWLAENTPEDERS